MVPTAPAHRTALLLIAWLYFQGREKRRQSKGKTAAESGGVFCLGGFFFFFKKAIDFLKLYPCATQEHPELGHLSYHCDQTPGKSNRRKEELFGLL